VPQERVKRTHRPSLRRRQEQKGTVKIPRLSPSQRRAKLVTCPERPFHLHGVSFVFDDLRAKSICTNQE
jgi:hypothetical protein